MTVSGISVFDHTVLVSTLNSASQALNSRCLKSRPITFLFWMIDSPASLGRVTNW
jgi:hypothetical protein